MNISGGLMSARKVSGIFLILNFYMSILVVLIIIEL
jgi:hypothetical protein